MSVRKVVVIDNPSINNLYPKINIIKEENKIEIGGVLEEEVSAYDMIDGDISEKIIKVDNVNTSEIGTYKKIYSVTNSQGYTTMISRDITVLQSLKEEDTSILTSVEDEKITNENVKIKIKVVGNNYDYIILPDKKTSKEKEMSYEAEENGEYIFTAVNKDGTTVISKVNISNIDRTTPTGTCKAILYGNKTSISVVGISFNRLVGYNYIINNQESGYITTSYYTSNTTSNSNIYVLIKDYVGNENKIQCGIEKKYSYDPNGYRDKTYIDVKPRLRIPIKDALLTKGHTVEELNRCIYDQVQAAGPGTRYGVVAAGYSLIDCTYKMTGYVLSYDHTGGKISGDNYCSFNSDICGKLGVNTKWGKAGGTCSSGDCHYGLNCATFVGWAMCNGGMDLCNNRSAGAYGMVSTDFFPNADGVYVSGDKVTYYSGNSDLTRYSANQLVRMLKPGDVFARKRLNDPDGSSQHAAVIVGVDNTGIYTANDGYFIQKISYSSLLDANMSYRLLFLDKYYDSESNRNSLYN